jgi:hypothetical protein
MSDGWLPSLKTDTPQAGFDLAVKLSRVGVKMTQPSDQVRSHLRAAYEQDSAQLIAASHVIAIHFQTVTAANNWWKQRQDAHRRGRLMKKPRPKGRGFFLFRGLGDAAWRASGAPQIGAPTS